MGWDDPAEVAKRKAARDRFYSDVVNSSPPGKISLARFNSWLKQNIGPVSDTAGATFWKNYVATDKLPFVTMEAARNQLLDLSNKDAQSGVDVYEAPNTTGYRIPGARNSAETYSEDHGRQTSQAPQPLPGSPRPGGNRTTHNIPHGGGIPELPTYESRPDFNGQYGDFSDEARQRTSEIFNPYYGALDKSATQGRADYGRYDTITAGLFDKLAADTANYRQQGLDTGAQLASQQQAAGTAGVDQIARTVQGQNTDTANFAKMLGVEEAAPSLIAGANQENAWQQGQLAQQNSTNLGALNANTATDANYMQKLGVAGQNRGVERRGELINQLADYLAQVDNYRASANSQQASQTQTLAQQLAEQDWQRQVQDYTLDSGAIDSRNTAAQNDYQNRYGIYKDEYTRNMDAQIAAQKAEADAAGGSGGGKAPEMTKMGDQFTKMVNQYTEPYAVNGKNLGDQFIAGLDQTNAATNSIAVWRAAQDRAAGRGTAAGLQPFDPVTSQAFLDYIQWALANGVIALQNQPTQPSSTLPGG